MEDLYLTRITLLNNIKDNKEEAWTEFCAFYWDVITGWARKFGCSEAVAKDIFQETVVSLMKQLPYFEYDTDKGKFRAFIKTIVKRRVYDIYRKEKKYINLDYNKDNDEGTSEDKLFDKLINEYTDPNNSAKYDLVWMDSLVRQAIRISSTKLDPQTYQSFKLYVLEERPVEDVLKQTGIETIGAVYQHKSRFLTSVKNEFYTLIRSCTKSFSRLASN